MGDNPKGAIPIAQIRHLDFTLSPDRPVIATAGFPVWARAVGIWGLKKNGPTRAVLQQHHGLCVVRARRNLISAGTVPLRPQLVAMPDENEEVTANEI